MSFPPEVYSRCLLGDYGYPLWTPQLNVELSESYQLEGLKIGDVGILSPNSGSFDVLFNITLLREEQPYPEFVGESFTPITLNRRGDLNTEPDALPAEYVFPCGSVQLVPAGVKVHSRDQMPSSYGRAQYEFSLSMGDGAVLVLPEGADKCDLKNERTFLNEAIRHGVSWYECATDPRKAGRLITNDSLYLITGFHKARSWSLGATDKNSSTLQNQGALRFEVVQIPRDRPTARAYYLGVVQGFMGRVGPLSPYAIPNYATDECRRGVNQTVFIRGFRITVNRLLLLFKTVSVETPQGTFGGVRAYVNNLLWGGSSESTPSSGGATDNEVNQDFRGGHSRLYADKHIAIDRVPDVPQTFHPGDLVNRYMLKKEPRAVLALTHDNLWIEMLQMELLELADFSREQRLEEVLSNNYRIIVEDGEWRCIPSKRESIPCGQSEPVSLTAGLTGSTQTLSISTSGLHPDHSGQHQVKEGPPSSGDVSQHMLPSLSSITHNDETIASEQDLHSCKPPLLNRTISNTSPSLASERPEVTTFASSTAKSINPPIFNLHHAPPISARSVNRGARVSAPLTGMEPALLIPPPESPPTSRVHKSLAPIRSPQSLNREDHVSIIKPVPGTPKARPSVVSGVGRAHERALPDEAQASVHLSRSPDDYPSSYSGPSHVAPATYFHAAGSIAHQSNSPQHNHSTYAISYQRPDYSSHLGHQQQQQQYIPTPSQAYSSTASAATSARSPVNPYYHMSPKPQHDVQTSPATSHGTGGDSAHGPHHPHHTGTTVVATGEGYQCHICFRSFISLHGRQQHYEAVHAVHKCQFCGRAFALRDSLKRHVDNGCDKLPRR